MHGSGHTVYVTESFPNHVCRGSRAVRADFVVPSIRFETGRCLDMLVEIVKREAIDVLIPTCEEVLYLAAERERFAGHCRLLTADFETLLTLHDKWRFVQRLEEIGLPVPRTSLLTSTSEVANRLAAGEGPSIVLKPVYSRFAARTVICPKQLEHASQVQPTLEEPWVAQQFLEGRQISTYSIAHEGRIAAHVAYPIVITVQGGGPTVVYEPISHPESLAFVREMAAALSFTGQFGVDFIESSDGTLRAIECNPRPTGGVHCFDGTPHFTSALLGDFQDTLAPRDLRTRIITSAMLTDVSRGLRSLSAIRTWARLLRHGCGVVYRPNDLRPALQQFAAAFYFARLSRREAINVREAVTWDLAFDGSAARACAAH